MSIYVSQPKLWKMLDGTPPVIQQVPEAASQSFIVGDFVYLVGGYATVCADDPQLIYGLALEAAHNTTAGLYKVDVLVITNMTCLCMNVHGVNPLDTVQAADWGKGWQIEKVSTNWVVNKDVATSSSVRIYEFIDELATVNGRVAVTVPAAIRQLELI